MLGISELSDSGDFSSFAGIDFYVALYPRGTDNIKKNTSVIYFFVIGEYEDDHIFGQFTISIYSANYSGFIESTYKKVSENCVFHCDTEEYFDAKNGYFVNGKMSVRIDGVLTLKKPIVDNSLSQKNILVNHLWEKSAKDFSFLVKGKTIEVCLNFCILHYTFILGSQMGFRSYESCL